MGDRSNIVIEDKWGKRTERVYLYSHWGGERVLKAAMTGLRSGRATDNQYLARIVFDAMVGEDQGSETGYGIGGRLGDNEHPILVISDTRNKGTVVYFENQSDYGQPFKRITKKMSYTEFVALVESIPEWEKLTDSNELYDLLIQHMAESDIA